MKRFQRILLRTGTLLSFVLFIAAAFMWARSYFVSEGISWGKNGYADNGTLIRRVVYVDSGHGRIHLTRAHFSSLFLDGVSPKEEGIHYLRPSPIVPAQSPDWSFAGFTYSSFGGDVDLQLGAFSVPYWFLLLTFGLFPALWLIRYILRKRPPSTTCPTCGYDMRATPHRCPECGAVPSSTAAVS
jgi:hypothetical protein